VGETGGHDGRDAVAVSSSGPDDGGVSSTSAIGDHGGPGPSAPEVERTGSSSSGTTAVVETSGSSGPGEGATVQPVGGTSGPGGGDAALASTPELQSGSDDGGDRGGGGEVDLSSDSGSDGSSSGPG